MQLLKSKRITRNMKELLVDLSQRTLLRLPFCKVGTIQGANYLIERGFIRTRLQKNKLLVFYVTDLVSKYLSKNKSTIKNLIYIQQYIP